MKDNLEIKILDLLNLKPTDTFNGILDEKVVHKLFNFKQPIKDDRIRVDFIMDNQKGDWRDRELAIVYIDEEPSLLYQIIGYMEIENIKIIDECKLGSLYLNFIQKERESEITIVDVDETVKVNSLGETIEIINNQMIVK